MSTGKLVDVNSISAADASGKMMYHKFQRRAVGANDVHIEIKYSGICHSDIHTAKGEWGPKQYPLCVGHEILGEVVSIGDKVTKFKVGDIAGVGCFTDSCRACPECKEGDEQYCTGEGGMHGTYGSARSEALHPGGQSMGGYATAIVVDEKYTLHVPANLNCAGGAPLLCAGVTCYSPFRHYGLKAGMELGVVGLGGLGHMAIKIAAAMGVNVTVVSRSIGKKEQALALGAKKFIISTNAEEMKAAAKTLHMIYDSIAVEHDVVSYLDLLRSSGTLITVGGDTAPMKVASFNLWPRRLKIGGSCIGGIAETQEMLDFCGKHNILADVEVVAAEPEAVDVAWERCLKSDVKFRFVIDTGKTLQK